MSNEVKPPPKFETLGGIKVYEAEAQDETHWMCPHCLAVVPTYVVHLTNGSDRCEEIQVA